MKAWFLQIPFTTVALRSQNGAVTKAIKQNNKNALLIYYIIYFDRFFIIDR